MVFKIIPQMPTKYALKTGDAGSLPYGIQKCFIIPLDSIDTFGCPISACWLPPHHNLYVFILPPDPAILLCRRHRREHGTKYCANKCLNGFELII